jgi:hypothetical protein
MGRSGLGLTYRKSLRGRLIMPTFEFDWYAEVSGRFVVEAEDLDTADAIYSKYDLTDIMKEQGFELLDYDLMWL